MLLFHLCLLGPYYTAVDLADFAKQLDEAERERMQEGDVNSQDYLKFMQVGVLTLWHKGNCVFCYSAKEAESNNVFVLWRILKFACIMVKALMPLNQTFEM